MKNILGKPLLTFLILLLTPYLSSAQKNDLRPFLNEDSNRKVSGLPAAQIDIPDFVSLLSEQQNKLLEEKPLSTEGAGPIKNRSFTFVSEITRSSSLDSRRFFGDHSKNCIETSFLFNCRKFNYENIFAARSVLNRQTNRNSPMDIVKMEDTFDQPVQEVFQMQMVYPQERGEVQITFNSRYGKSSDHGLFQTPFSIEYGIDKNWQVEMEWDAQSRRHEIGESPTGGTGDLSFSTQYSFMKMHGSNFHSAIGFEITLPTADVEKELTEGLVQYEPYFLIAKDFPTLNNLQIFSQVGIGFNQKMRRKAHPDPVDEPAVRELNLGIGAFVPFRRAVFTGELNLNTNLLNNGTTQRETYFTPGVVWRLPHNLELGVGIPLGLTSDSDQLGTIFKLVYEFNLFGKGKK